MDLAALSSDGTIHLLQRSTQKVPQAADVSEQPPGVSPYQVWDEMRKRFLEGVKASVLVPMWQPDKKQAWKEVRGLRFGLPRWKRMRPRRCLRLQTFHPRSRELL